MFCYCPPYLFTGPSSLSISRKNSGLTKYFSQREDADLPDASQDSLGFNGKAEDVNPLLCLLSHCLLYLPSNLQE